MNTDDDSDHQRPQGDTMDRRPHPDQLELPFLPEFLCDICGTKRLDRGQDALGRNIAHRACWRATESWWRADNVADWTQMPDRIAQ